MSFDNTVDIYIYIYYLMMGNYLKYLLNLYMIVFYNF